MSKANVITYVKNMFDNRKTMARTVTHDELDTWTHDDFVANGCFELISDAEYVHLYFDFDYHDADYDGILDVMRRLQVLEAVFGTMYYAGYCTDVDLCDGLDMPWIEYKDDADALDKVFSMHVVFPETCISRSALCEIIKRGGFKEADAKVYKEPGKQQLMRHPYANKKEGDCRAVELEDGPKPSQLVLTCNGRERSVIGISQWPFPLKPLEPTFNVRLSAPLDDEVNSDIYAILDAVTCGTTFGHDQIIREIPLFIPKNYTAEFMKCYEKLYTSHDHRTAEDLNAIYASCKTVGFCQVMSNIKGKYFELNDGVKLVKLSEMTDTKLEKVSADDRSSLERYRLFMRAWYNVVNDYFVNYDYIHTSATAERFLQKEDRFKKHGMALSSTYKQLYLRKILYICDDSYLYRKNECEIVHRTLDNRAFKTQLKATYDISKKDSWYSSLKKFKAEATLESEDGLVYPRYRDMKYDYELSDAEFERFCTMYKATFADECCAEFALKLLIQDIASGFHDNAGIIKFYYGSGGNNKDCETQIYENIIGVHDLVFKTHDYKVLADEKNKSVVGSLYVQFNEMPAVTNLERFHEFVNALKNYNECGHVKTRAMYKDFENIETNIRFQCNTNNAQVRDVLLRDANDAIKRRFFIAHRVHSDQWSDDLWRFSHDVKQCRALKMYIVNRREKLYTERLNNVSMLAFNNEHHDLYDLYTEGTKNELHENLMTALKGSGAMPAKRSKTAEETTFMVKITDWHRMYKADFDTKITLNAFKSLVNEHLDYGENVYVMQSDGSWTRERKKYLLKSPEFIEYLNSNSSFDV